ncbi:MAG: glycyl-radical enzyme activating protein [Ruminococcaceae bacterium]|jgi:pyruvate formate lyase activating enzyme|nr:glycyl-radical enzyme activating protein [Oscillospiraceae bacterium]
MSTPLVFNIQKFSVHDGDGIRTTIFFKGCPLRCAWCHNPESQSYEKELILHRHKCTACGSCVKRCPVGANEIVDGTLVFHREKCTGCGACIDWCIPEARELAGREYTVDELVKEAKKDLPFYEQSGGGVTLSGGEVLSMRDMDYVEELCRRLKREGVSVFIDTSGFAPYEHFARLLPYVDAFLYDVKGIDPDEHRENIGADNTLILANLIRLSNDGARIYLRLPIVEGKNDSAENITKLAGFLRENHIEPYRINLLPYHDIGRGKYAGLDRPYDEEGMHVPSGERMEELKAMFETHGFHNIKIGG